MPSATVIQLRRLLSEKFPGLRMGLDNAAAHDFWPTGLPQIDHQLGGGLARKALTEVVGSQYGSALLLHEVLSHAARQNQITTLIDGSDSLDLASFDESVLARLLWVRCRKAEDALKATDLVLRDSNLPLVLLDLKINSERELRKIPATTWYRFQRLVEETNSICLIFTPRPMIAPAQTRILLRSQFSLADMDGDADERLRRLKVEVSDARQFEAGQVSQVFA